MSRTGVGLRRRVGAGAAYVLLLLAAEGCLGWTLSAVDRWLLLPELVLLATGLASTLTWVAYAVVRGSRTARGAAGVTAGTTAAVIVLTYLVALPLKMVRVSTVGEARARALIGRQSGDPLQSCSTDARDLRPVGSLIHASSACARTPTVSLVSWNHGAAHLYYGPSGPRSRQLTFWPDVCFRHLYGPWWALHDFNPDDPGRPCPFGYTFEGGP